MYSNTFQCECCTIPLGTFLNQFYYMTSKIIPHESFKKYLYKPLNVVTTSMEEITPQFLDCYGLEEMQSAFVHLSPEERHHVILGLELLELQFSSLPKDTLVCVPELPKNYIKPFFLGLLTTGNILV